MKKSKFVEIISIIIIATFILTGMNGVVPQNSSHVKINLKKVSYNSQKIYNSYFVCNKSNMDDKIVDVYVQWLMDRENANPFNGGNISRFHMPSSANESKMFSLFLEQNPSITNLLEKLTKDEETAFSASNIRAGQNILRYLQENPGTQFYKMDTNNSMHVAIKNSNNMYPGNFPVCTGEYTMVSVNYLRITAPWYLGGWTITYGEDDTINILFVGSSAQSWYNHEYSTINTISSWAAAAGVVTGGAVFLGGQYGILSSAIKGIASEIAVIISLTGFTISAIQHYMGAQLHSMYDSTYANPLSGELKFIWEFYSVTYIYPWVTTIGTFLSTFTWNGYTNSGTVSILPYIPVASNNPAWVITASALSSEAHNLAYKIGWNSWGIVR